MEEMEQPVRKRPKLELKSDFETTIAQCAHIGIQIFSYLDIKSLLHCSIVSKSFNEFIKAENSIWTSHLERLKHQKVPKRNYRTLQFEYVDDFIQEFPQWNVVFEHFKKSRVCGIHAEVRGLHEQVF